ncbi:MAG: hypothetical protein WC188_12545 [Candidatus Caldatribacteriota bacterium]
MYSIFIDDKEVVVESNFEINEEFMNTSSIVFNKVYPKSWKGTNKLLTDYYFPKDYSKCNIYKDSVLVFSGIVKNSANMVLNPFKPHYCSLQILDKNTLLSEGKTLDFVIADKTVSEAIAQVIDEIANYGFVVGTISIENDSMIGAYSTLDKTAFDVFQYLSEISNSRWGTRMVDEDTTAVDFYSPALMPSESDIEFTQKYFANNNIIDMEYDYNTNDYRNKQVILSDSIYASIDSIENIITDGYNTTFITEKAIGIINSMTLDGNAVTFATNDEKNIGISADFYYTSGEAKITSDKTYQAGLTIQINYTALIKGRQIGYNNNEISRIKGQLDINGTISRYEKRNDILSSDELQAVANTYINYNSKPELTLTIKTKNNLFSLGKKVYFNAPLEDLKDTYLIKSKKTSIQQVDTNVFVEYEFALVNNFDTESAINYFDNQRRKANGNINESEFITRNIDIENEANVIFSNVTQTEVTPVGDNVLNCVLNSPFIS